MFKYTRQAVFDNQVGVVVLKLQIMDGGVFERIAYPWFRPVWMEMPGGVTEFTSEDVGFCIQAKKEGFTVMVDPTVIVGHEKPSAAA